jgi:hypothetical protein
MRNVQKVSAVVLGMLAGFAINKYATAENFTKLKEKIKDTYDDLSKKFDEATEPKVEYVSDSDVEDDVVVDESLLTQAMDILGDRSEDEDILFIGTIGFDKLSDAYYAMSCILEKLVDKKSYFTVYELVKTLFEDEPCMFDYITKKYDYDDYTLAKYGWVDPSAFEIRYNQETDKYIITDVAPVRLYTNEEKEDEDKNTEPDTGSAEDTNVM